MSKAPETTKADSLIHAQNIGSNKYKEIDWRNPFKPTESLTVMYSNASSVAAALLYLLFGGLSLMLLLNSGTKQPAIFIVVFNALIIAFIVYIRAKAKRRSVKTFDAAGVLTSTGEKFLWTDFRGKAVREGGNRYGRKYVWRIELLFTGNRQLWILPQRVKNVKEVSDFVNTLPLATLQ